MVTVDVVVFAFFAGHAKLLLINRAKEPFKGKWALPGGFIEIDEDLEDAVARELAEETGLTDVPLEQMHTFGKCGRDPRGRQITIAFMGIATKGHKKIKAGDDAGVARWFDIEKLPLDPASVWPQVDDFLVAGTDEVRLVLYGPEKDQLLKLRLHDPAGASQMMPAFHSDLYKSLGVSVVDHVLLEKLLELENNGEAAVLSYSYNRQEAIERVAEQEYQLSILLSPMPSGVIKAIADSGDRMPRKSTYFYPKAPSGLVFYRMA